MAKHVDFITKLKKEIKTTQDAHQRLAVVMVKPKGAAVDVDFVVYGPFDSGEVASRWGFAALNNDEFEWFWSPMHPPFKA